MFPTLMYYEKKATPLVVWHKAKKGIIGIRCRGIFHQDDAAISEKKTLKRHSIRCVHGTLVFCHSSSSSPPHHTLVMAGGGWAG